MNLVFWKHLPDGIYGPPAPLEVNIFAIVIPVVIIGIVAYSIISKRKKTSSQ